MPRQKRTVATLVESSSPAKRVTRASVKREIVGAAATGSVVVELTTRVTKKIKTSRAVRAIKNEAVEDKLSAIDHGDAADPDPTKDECQSSPAENIDEDPVDSTYLPLPWRGRLGYACINTYLRSANPPVFCSRTCRIASIIEHRHPLRDPSLPYHATKNRPDKSQPASIDRGQAYVQALGLANARDIVHILRWNERYGLRFLRLSSDIFPLASHAEHGYSLAFASEALAEAGRVAGQLNHRLTMHPGQYTQLGSPRPEVVDAAIRDLAYHDELLTLLRLPPQLDRDAVMILHMGGVFGDKQATLARFRDVYTTRLSASVQRRLVLENDDVSWSVHDLLPVCEDLGIPLVLDFHHHNIVWDATQGIRAGTADVAAGTPLAERIRATWTRKGVTQKMHYSEPAIKDKGASGHDRRKHSARVLTLPPCPPDMDLMIEAKDKEQAVFALMRTFQLPGSELFSNMEPHVRDDEESGRDSDSFGMGGPGGKVFWPEGQEGWLKRKK